MENLSQEELKNVYFDHILKCKIYNLNNEKERTTIYYDAREHDKAVKSLIDNGFIKNKDFSSNAMDVDGKILFEIKMPI
ncbi:MAG: hypothetical protein GY853_15365 [PVC group bacterium]|nr:hypothetical protein [PVC group bacterium]